MKKSRIRELDVSEITTGTRNDELAQAGVEIYWAITGVAILIQASTLLVDPSSSRNFVYYVAIQESVPSTRLLVSRECCADKLPDTVLH